MPAALQPDVPMAWGGAARPPPASSVRPLQRPARRMQARARRGPARGAGQCALPTQRPRRRGGNATAYVRRLETVRGPHGPPAVSGSKARQSL